nr:M13 family metallopeptidase [uncultured Holophaga sp.]
MPIPLPRLSGLALALTLGLAPLAAQTAPHGIDRGNLDTAVKPCEDFFRYANGQWIAHNPIPADQTSWGAFNELYENNRKLIRTLLEEAAAARALPGSATQKVGDYYASGMDGKAIEKAGLKPFAPTLARIKGVTSSATLASVLGGLHQEGVSHAAFSMYVGQDDKDSSHYILQLSQGGLGLPDRDYYTRTDAKSLELKAKYEAHVATMFRLLGDSAPKAAAEAKTVLTLETKLAEASRTRVELRDPQANYHKLTPAELEKSAPGFAWSSYFKAIGLKPQKDLVVGQPAFFKAFGALAAGTPLAQWRTYLRWHAVRAYSSALPDRFGQESFAFYGKTLQGAEQRQERWKRVQDATGEALGELVGQLYVAKAFPPESKAKMIELVGNLKAALSERIQAAPWMSEVTRQQALHKLETFGLKIGYPDKWRDYSKLEVTRGSFLENERRAARFEFQRNLAKLGQPIDRGEWDMTPQTVNAYYSPNMNEIVFPAGILQPPFFDPKADDAVNYGAIGMVIGHEMTHGFDDQGCQYDAQGNLKNWWTPEDKKAYDARTALVVKQYDAYEPLPGLHVNGKLTLGENIADIGGLKVAFEALKKQWAKAGKPGIIDGFTPEQRFFLGYAQAWRFHARDAMVRLRVQTDPHSPAKFRVDGPLSDMPEFFEAFGCGVGNPMVRQEQERPAIW